MTLKPDRSQRAAGTFALTLLASASLLLAAAPAAAQKLPQLGSDGLMSLSQEARIGNDVAREIYKDPEYLDDPLLVEYVDGIMQKLLTSGRASGTIDATMNERFVWRLMLGANRTINAFSVPGGVFGVHAGLVGMTANADELASVLAHEISHVTQRHIARMQQRQAQMQPLLIGSMILGAIAAGKNADMGSAVLVGGQAATIQNQLSYSREMEREADRLGFLLLQQAGFRTAGFTQMFEKLQKANRINDDGSFPYLRTHPLTLERIADMRGRVPLAAAASGATLDRQHALMAARARVLATDRVDSWRTMLEQAQLQLKAEPSAAPKSASATTERLALLYQGACAALRLNDRASAAQLAAALQKALPKTGQAGQQAGSNASAAQVERIVKLLDADIASAQGQWPLVAQLSAARADFYRPEFLLHTRALAEQGRAELAAEQLQQWVAERPSDAGAWLALSQVDTRLGRTAQSVRAQAEASVAHYDYGMALAYLRSARNLQRQNLVEASILDARIKEVEALQKWQDESS